MSIRKQRVVIYDADGEVTNSRISSGRPGFDTPTGVFSLLEKDVHHRSNIYDGAEMPFMQRITWSGVALHAGVVPGYRASHGCIRLPYNFARSLFGLTKIGARVVVTGDEAEPISFDSPKLFKPLPLDDATAMKSGMREQKIAINDRGGDPAASDALSDLPRLIGVSPAMAKAFADMPREPQRPTTRIEAERMFSEKLAQMRTDLTAAENARIAATEKAKAAVKDYDAINDRMTGAQRGLDQARTAVKSAEKKQLDAARSFESLMTNASSGPSALPGDWQDREADVADALLNASSDADQARADVVRNEFKIAELKSTYGLASSARAAAFDAVQQAQIILKTAQAALIDANKQVLRRNKPVSVFVSLRSGRISVRQGVDPVVETSIPVNVPSSRVGTHVFTAMRYGHDPNQFDWKLVSAHTPSPGEAFEEPKTKRRRHKDSASPQSNNLNVRMANAALDAFTIPDDIQATIAELAKPGSSLIVSDRDLPEKENGAGTEFVVLTR